MIPDHIVDQVKAATDLPGLVQEYGVKLQRVSGGFLALCPFHGEKTASFRVHTQGDRAGSYKCFGCGAAGNPITFVSKIESVPFPEALKRLAERAGISLRGGRVNRVQAVASKQDAAFSTWWWKQRWDMVRELLDEAMLASELQPDDEWADCLGRMLRAIETMKPADRAQQFSFNVTGKDRSEWKAEVAEDKAFAEFWVGLAA